MPLAARKSGDGSRPLKWSFWAEYRPKSCVLPPLRGAAASVPRPREAPAPHRRAAIRCGRLRGLRRRPVAATKLVTTATHRDMVPPWCSIAEALEILAKLLREPVANP